MLSVRLYEKEKGEGISSNTLIGQFSLSLSIYPSKDK